MKIVTKVTRGNILTPCVEICKMDKETKLCLGCKRTAKELKEWRRMNQEQRRAVIEELHTRE